MYVVTIVVRKQPGYTCRMFRILGKLIIQIMRTQGEKYLQCFFLKIQDKRHSSVFVSVHVFKFLTSSQSYPYSSTMVPAAIVISAVPRF